MRIKLYKTEISLLLITLFVIGLMFQLNDITRHIRIRELRLLLLKNVNKESNIDHIGLLARYRIQKMKYEKLINQEEADREEIKVASILTDRLFVRSVPIDKYKYISKPALVMINFFRSMTGKSPIMDPQDNRANIFLEIAYYYERNSYFPRALKIYDKALSEEKYDRSKIAAIQLHRGYCYAIKGEYPTARKELRKVIENYGHRPVANTALILLRYITGFKTETDRVMRSMKDSLNKIEKLYHLNAPGNAMNIIEKIGKRFSGKERAKMLYIKARCLEELSKKEKAIDTYQMIINEGDDLTYARSANRRIYISGALASNSNGERVKELAIKNNASLNDGAFKRMLQDESKLRDDDRKNSWMNEQISLSQDQNTVLKTERIKSLKNREADSTTKKPVQKRKRPKPLKKRVGGKVKAKELTVRIKTREGSVFIGIIKKETADSLVIHSILGDVEIPKKNITGQTIIK
jgi:tetratricopeptide (TPR) repeat protein